MLIDVDDRQRATIIAGLLYWQQALSSGQWREALASLHMPDELGKQAPLSVDDITALCDRINTERIETPEVVVHVEGGNVQAAWSNVPGLAFDLVDSDNMRDSDYKHTDEAGNTVIGALSGIQCDAALSDAHAGMAVVY